MRGTRSRVLIVDDEIFFLEAIDEILSEGGFETVRNHGNVHPNVIPRSVDDVARGQQAILECGQEIIRLGGCPLAEHGVGRNPIKQERLRRLYGDEGIAEMRAVKAAGTTILLTTHYMEEAYELCDEIAIMDHGSIIARGAPDELLSQHFDDVVIQLPSEDIPATCQLDAFAHTRREDSVRITTSDVNRTIEQLLACQVPLHHLRIRARDLEDLFLELTGKELRQ